MSIKAQNSIGVIGAGTMGVGIAQAAAGAGWPVILFDIEQSLVDQAKDSITKRFQRLVEKNRITESEATSCQERINATTSMEDLSNCDLIVEAIVENYDIKVKVLKQVGSIAPDAVIATNTSSLSITDLGDACGFSDRVVGMHFFNPAPIMPLVEIIRGKNSRESSIQRATLLAEAWGKTVVHVSDTPGFIVNRVARPYYLESW